MLCSIYAVDCRCHKVPFPTQQVLKMIALTTNSLSIHITLLFISPVSVGAFGVWPGIAPLSFDTTTTASCLGMLSTPPGGDGSWENDDFLESLSGNSGGAAGNFMNTGGEFSAEEPVERVVPENDMTDEEITMMAMRAAQFYNTDKSIDEAYGVPRSGPPRKKDAEDESEFQ